MQRNVEPSRTTGVSWRRVEEPEAEPLVPRFGDNLDWENQAITTRSVSKGQNR